VLGTFWPLIVSIRRAIHEGPSHHVSPAAFRIVARMRGDLFIKRGTNGGDQATQPRVEKQSKGPRPRDSRQSGNTAGIAVV
jgi:hypothetical protein